MDCKFYASYGSVLRILDLDIKSDLEDMLAPIGEAIRKSIETIDEADNMMEKQERNWIIDDECDSIENWVGLAFVATQTYLTRVTSRCRRLHDWHEHQTKSRLLLGIEGKRQEILGATTKVRRTNYTAVEAVNAFANYFKHREEWPFDWTQLERDIEKRTAKVIQAFGARPGSTGNLRQGYASVLGDGIAFNEVARLGDVVHTWACALRTAYEQELREGGFYQA